MAASIRGLLALSSWLFLAGAIVMMFFVVLSGVTDHTPLNMIYFLRANTSDMGRARPISQWTYFYVCGDNNQDCGEAVAALPFGFAWYGNTSGVPAELVGNHASQTTSSHYFYLWRFGWVFYLLGLIFAVFSTFCGLLSFTRLGLALTGILTGIACFWTFLAAILMTTTFVEARDVFNTYGRDASVGAYAFGFTWAAVVCLGIAAVLFFGGCLVGRGTGDAVRRRSFFRRYRRPRGSYVENGRKELI